MGGQQAGASQAWGPIPVPSRRPRSVSVIGVNGWYSANQRKPTGSELVGTKPLPRKGSRIRNIGELLAVSPLLAARPSPTVSQGKASDTSTSRAAAASHSSGGAGGREP